MKVKRGRAGKGVELAMKVKRRRAGKGVELAMKVKRRGTGLVKVLEFCGNIYCQTKDIPPAARVTVGVHRRPRDWGRCGF